MLGKIKQLVRQNPWAYDAARNALMAYRRKRYRLRDVAKTFYMVSGSTVHPDLVADDFSFINKGCYVGPRVSLGKYAMLGPRVAVVGADHLIDRPGVPITFSGRPAMPATKIEDDAWLGYGAVIMAGVTVGRGAIVAAGAVVTRDVPAYEIYGGVPARKIGERFSDEQQRKEHDAMLNKPAKRGDYCPAPR